MGWTTTRRSRDEVTRAQMEFTTVSGLHVVATEYHRHQEQDWFLYEVRDASGLLIHKQIGLTVWDGESFKQMSEENDPYYFNCPLWWLDQVPAPAMVNPDFNWRDSVRVYGSAAA